MQIEEGVRDPCALGRENEVYLQWGRFPGCSCFRIYFSKIQAAWNIPFQISLERLRAWFHGQTVYLACLSFWFNPQVVARACNSSSWEVKLILGCTVSSKPAWAKDLVFTKGEKAQIPHRLQKRGAAKNTETAAKKVKRENLNCVCI